MDVPYYLKVGRAQDLTKRGERVLYRFLEMLPGLLSWGTLLAAVLLSWLQPVAAAVFVILLDLYWLLRIVYFSAHLAASYRIMRRHEKTNWLMKLEQLEGAASNIKSTKNWREIWQLVVFPTLREPLAVARGSLQALLKTNYPKDKMIVVWATEQKGGAVAQQTAQTLRQEFGNKFFKFIVTCHPANVSGEVAGKGANESYALKQVKTELIDELKLEQEKIIVSSFDADTVLLPEYFGCLTYHYLTAKEPTRSSFQPVPIYINNIWHASFFSRLFAFSSTFWHTMNQERPDRLITFSSQSMSFKALVEVGFKQPNVISEDSRIFWQCFFYYHGHYRTIPLYYPVRMDAVAAPSFWQTCVSLYKQQRRWAYGMENIPYMLFGFLKTKGIGFRKKLSFTVELMEGHWSWATAPILIFCLGWLPLWLGGAEFKQTLLSYNLPDLTSKILTFSMLGIIISVLFSLRLLPAHPSEPGKLKYVKFALQWIFLPLITFFFSALPALDAQTRWLFGRYMGFQFTEKHRQ